MADFGAFLQGLTKSFQQGQQLSMQRDDMKMRRDLLNAQIKASDIETELKKNKANMILQVLGGGAPGGGGLPGPVISPAETPVSADMPLPSIIASRSMPVNFSVPSVDTSIPRASSSPTAPARIAGGPDVSSVFNPTNVMRGVFKETFGIDPKEQQQWRQADYVDPSTGKRGKIDKEMSTGEIRTSSFVPDAELDKTTFSQENQLRDQFTAATAPFRLVRDSWSRIQESASKPGGAGDLALIYDYMKMLDPGSTVREGEFANAQNAGGIGDKLRGEYNRLVNGGRLSDQQRENFVGLSRQLFETANNQYKQVVSEYSRISGQYPNVDPKRVIVDFSLSPANNMRGKPSLSLGKKKRPLSAFEGE